jgi:hypothetical protein
VRHRSLLRRKLSRTCSRRMFFSNCPAAFSLHAKHSLGMVCALPSDAEAMGKTNTAMTNEVLCKFLCQNLTCLIQEQETLGIAPIFWNDERTSTGIFCR